MNEFSYEAGASMARLKRDEGLAFQRLAAMLADVAVPSLEATRAAHIVRRVWLALIVDLGSPDNGYPTPLKVDLLGVGVAMIRDAERLLEGEREAAARLVDLCTTLSDGLLGQLPPHAASQRAASAGTGGARA